MDISDLIGKQAKDFPQTSEPCSETKAYSSQPCPHRARVVGVTYYPASYDDKAKTGNLCGVHLSRMLQVVGRRAGYAAREQESNRRGRIAAEIARLAGVPAPRFGWRDPSYSVDEVFAIVEALHARCSGMPAIDKDVRALVRREEATRG